MYVTSSSNFIHTHTPQAKCKDAFLQCLWAKWQVCSMCMWYKHILDIQYQKLSPLSSCWILENEYLQAAQMLGFIKFPCCLEYRERTQRFWKQLSLKPPTHLNSVTFHHTLRENNVHQTSFLPFPFPYKGNHRGPALVCSPYTIPPSRKDPQNFRENHKSRFYVNEKVIKPCKYQQN